MRLLGLAGREPDAGALLPGGGALRGPVLARGGSGGADGASASRDANALRTDRTSRAWSTLPAALMTMVGNA